MLDDRVLEVLARMEREDAEERERGLDIAERSLAIMPTTGRFLFSLVAGQDGCEVLEIGGSRGYSSIWLGAGVRYLGGHVLSLEQDPVRAEAWRRNVSDAGLSDWVEQREGDALATLAAIDDVFDVVFLDAWKDDYEAYFALARERLEPGGLVVADNVLSHVETLGAYSQARQSDSGLSSVTVPLDSGLEVTTILTSR
jgi:predicted O-methyltransferase YrrM